MSLQLLDPESECSFKCVGLTKGNRIKIDEIRRRVAANPEYDQDTMSDEQKEIYKQELRDFRALQATGARSTNAGATQDMRRFADRLDIEVCRAVS